MFLSLLVAAILVTAAMPALASTPVTVLVPPVDGPVVSTFDAPTRYGPGHRGVDLATPSGTPVRAPAAGRVAFAGVVVGDRWVTVDHGGLRSTMGPLATVTVVPGDQVGLGAVLGTSGHAHGRPGVHWSVRRGANYLDPLGVRARVATLLPDRTGGGAAARDQPPGPGWRSARVR